MKTKITGSQLDQTMTAMARFGDPFERHLAVAWFAGGLINMAKIEAAFPEAISDCYEKFVKNQSHQTGERIIDM